MMNEIVHCFTQMLKKYTFFSIKTLSFKICHISEASVPSAKLVCVVCKDGFTSCWDLMVHAQAAHMINIYEIGDKNSESPKSTATAVAATDSTTTTSIMAMDDHGVETATANDTDEVSRCLMIVICSLVQFKFISR